MVEYTEEKIKFYMQVLDEINKMDENEKRDITGLTNIGKPPKYNNLILSLLEKEEKFEGYSFIQIFKAVLEKDSKASTNEVRDALEYLEIFCYVETREVGKTKFFRPVDKKTGEKYGDK